MSDPLISSFYHAGVREVEAAASFEPLLLFLHDVDDRIGWFQVAGKELDAYEVVVRAGAGYQLLRYGWLWMPPNIRPRPSEISKPKWHLVDSTFLDHEEAERYAAETPIIGGPVEISKDAEIRRP